MTTKPQAADVYGQLTVIGPSDRGPKYLLCRCSCGAEKSVREDHLRTGRTLSCGCLRRLVSHTRAKSGVMALANMKHGMCRSRVYSIWCGMHQRCRNPNHRAYKDYGGRGIYVCERWQRFENFLADMGEPPDGMTIDRINNDGPYEPGNCQWATRQEQSLNKRDNVWITVNGETKTVTNWSRQLGLGHSTVSERLLRGVATADAVSTVPMRNLSGLALGGKANGERQKAKTHCKYGHLFDEANTYFNGKQRVCRACKRERARCR
jgi:hypothetical protein